MTFRQIEVMKRQNKKLKAENLLLRNVAEAAQRNVLAFAPLFCLERLLKAIDEAKESGVLE